MSNLSVVLNSDETNVSGKGSWIEDNFNHPLSSAGAQLESNVSQKLYLTGRKLPGRFPEVNVVEITHRPCVVDPVEKIQEFAADIELACFPKERKRKGSLHG
jgi:hypothetical protein